MEDLILGKVYPKIMCETFRDPATNRIRVRPLLNQGLPNTMFIECDKAERDAYPIGTKFMTTGVKVCRKPNGRWYLKAIKNFINKISN